jgi:hypothetical protein
VILAGIVVGMVVRGIDGRFSSDLIESSQYMENARDFDPNLALFVVFFSSSKNLVHVFAMRCVHSSTCFGDLEDRERCRRRMLFATAVGGLFFIHINK